MRWVTLCIGLTVAAMLAVTMTRQRQPEQMVRSMIDGTKSDPYRPAYESLLAMKAEQISPNDLVTSARARITALDGSTGDYNAVIDLVSDLDVQLANLRTSSTKDNVLYGLPVVIKDNIAIKGEPTTAGSLALAQNTAAMDADVVAQLRQAGAVILARTNLSEWANFRDNRSTSGWSSVGGQTRNAYDSSRSPCGSSSGSAVAVALGYAPFALGTETDGSIICPASMNGIVGIKPTHALVSQKGVIPLAQSQDVVGPMARNVRDAALLLSAILREGHHHRAERIRRAGETPSALNQLKLGVVTNLGNTNARVNDLFAAFQSQLRAAGVQLSPVKFPALAEISQGEIVTLYTEFRRDINRYLKVRAGRLSIDSLASLIEYNQTNRETVMPHFGQDRFIQAEQMATLDQTDYQLARARAQQLAGPNGIDFLLRENQLDALIVPSNGPAWRIDYSQGDGFEVGSSTPAAVSGYPSITVPMGQLDGLPIGLSLIGGEFDDEKLIRIAGAIEGMTGGYIPPPL